MRRLVRAGDQMLAGDVHASGQWKRTLTPDEMSSARKQIEVLQELLDGPRALGAIVSRSHASITNYRRSLNVPVAVAARLAYLSGLVDTLGRHTALADWLGESNAVLDGQRPSELLMGERKPTDAGPARVMQAAAARLNSRPAA